MVNSPTMKTFLTNRSFQVVAFIMAFAFLFVGSSALLAVPAAPSEMHTITAKVLKVEKANKEVRNDIGPAKSKITYYKVELEILKSEPPLKEKNFVIPSAIFDKAPIKAGQTITAKTTRSGDENLNGYFLYQIKVVEAKK